MVNNQIGGQALIVFYILIFAVIYYFLLYLPQKRRAQERQDLMKDLKADDEVITIGGIIGKVKSIEGELVMLEVDKDVVLKISKDAIASIISEEESEKIA